MKTSINYNSDIICPNCGSDKILENETLKFDNNDIESENLYEYKCSDCGYEFNID